MQTETITINNKLSLQQQQIEEIENEKTILNNKRKEIAAEKSQETTETGKILMTINNLHEKCEEKREGMIISRKDFEDSGTGKTLNYNDTANSCKKAIE